MLQTRTIITVMLILDIIIIITSNSAEKVW